MIISSQKYINDEIVAAKLKDRDFTVTISPEFVIDGELYQVVLDGHHSFAAANLAGVEPEYEIATHQDDRLYLLDAGDFDSFLIACRMDCDWYDVADGVDVW